MTTHAVYNDQPGDYGQKGGLHESEDHHVSFFPRGGPEGHTEREIAARAVFDAVRNVYSHPRLALSVTFGGSARFPASMSCSDGFDDAKLREAILAAARSALREFRATLW